jgi:hypothetical protein
MNMNAMDNHQGTGVHERKRAAMVKPSLEEQHWLLAADSAKAFVEQELKAILNVVDDISQTADAYAASNPSGTDHGLTQGKMASTQVKRDEESAAIMAELSSRLSSMKMIPVRLIFFY